MSDHNGNNSFFWRGLRDTTPFLVIIVPFGLLFGAISIEAGLKIIEVLGFSVLIMAGAAQFTAVALISDNTPTVIVLLTALAVNLRMAMYSAALVPHLGKAPLSIRTLTAYFITDQTFALGVNTYETIPNLTYNQKFRYFVGSFVMIAVPWVTATFAGIKIGAEIPPEYALDFAVPICFIALSAPLIRSIPHAVAAFVSVLGSLLFVSVPHSLGILLAALLAILAAGQVDHWLERRAR